MKYVGEEVGETFMVLKSAAVKINKFSKCDPLEARK